MAFEKLAQTHLKLDSRLEAASSYVEAAKCYQKTNKSGRGLLQRHSPPFILSLFMS